MSFFQGSVAGFALPAAVQKIVEITIANSRQKLAGH
jgi:hypothetical protein